MRKICFVLLRFAIVLKFSHSLLIRNDAGDDPGCTLRSFLPWKLVMPSRCRKYNCGHTFPRWIWRHHPQLRIPSPDTEILQPSPRWFFFSISSIHHPSKTHLPPASSESPKPLLGKPVSCYCFLYAQGVFHHTGTSQDTVCKVLSKSSKSVFALSKIFLPEWSTPIPAKFFYFVICSSALWLFIYLLVCLSPLPLLM